MSWLRRFSQTSTKPTEAKKDYSPCVRYAMEAMPAVKFDPSTVSKNVKADLRKNVNLLDDIEKKHAKQIYEAALRSISAGRDLQSLCTALMKVKGVTKGRAAEIALSLNNKATAMINRERQSALGIAHAIWMYANAPCMKDPSHSLAADAQQDAAHRSANGQKYEISKGLFVDGKWTWPGVEEGCKCCSRSVLPGLKG